MSFRKLKCRIKIRINSKREITSDGNVLVTVNPNTKFTFSEIIQISTSESVENITNTASFSMPKGLRFKYPNPSGEDFRISPDKLFDEGDQVKIEMWYEVPIQNTFNLTLAQEINSNPNYKATFTGYISSAEVGDVIRFNCENEMYLFKRNSRLFPDDFLTGRKIKGEVIPAEPIITATSTNAVGKVTVTKGNTLGTVTPNKPDTYDHKTTSLDKALKAYFEKVEYYDWDTDSMKKYSLSDVTYEKMELSGYQSEGHVSLAALFDALKDYASINAFWRDSKLYIGPYSWPVLQKTKFLFAFRQNIIDATDLAYQRAENVKYRIEMYNVKDGKQQKIMNGDDEFFGDYEGEVRKMHVTGFDFDKKNKTTEKQLEELRKRAEKELSRYKYTGYSGSFDTFGAPVAKIADIVELYDPNYTGDDRNGSYLVKGVDREYDASKAQYRQKIYVHQKI